MPTRRPTAYEIQLAAALIFPVTRAKLVARYRYGLAVANRIIWTARFLGRKIITVQTGKTFTYEEQKMNDYPIKDLTFFSCVLNDEQIKTVCGLYDQDLIISGSYDTWEDFINVHKEQKGGTTISNIE
jgi:hypothetical protein